MQRFYSLDCLKYILAVIIVFHHFQQVLNVKFSGINFFFGDIYFGYAVEFFFIIAGFLSALEIDKIGQLTFWYYLRKKILRLYPMIWISVFTTVITVLLYHNRTGIWMDSTVQSIKLILCSLFGIQGLFPNLGILINNPMWFVSVLIVCYATLWGIVWVATKYKISCCHLFVDLILIGIILVRKPLFSGTGRGYMAFFLGLLLFYAREYIETNTKIFKIAWATSSTIILAMCFGALIKGQQWSLTFIIFPTILFTLLNMEHCFNWHRLCKFLGGTSYEMYVWHAFMLMLLKEIVKYYPMPLTYTSMIMFTLCVSVIGGGIYWLLEDKVNRFVVLACGKMLGEADRQ